MEQIKEKSELSTDQNNNASDSLSSEFPNFENRKARIELAKEIVNLEKPFAVMSIGIPGSGKSRIVAELVKLIGQDDNGNDVAVVNPDSIREEMTGDAADQSKNREVWMESYKRMEKLLKDGISVIVDATFVDKRSRRTFIENCKNANAASIAAVVVETDLDVAKKRNSERQRKVPEYVLDNMHERLKMNPVSKAEGIDLVSILSNNVNDPELQ